MINITALNDEDFETLCRIIAGKRFKSCFKKNSSFFGTIKPGFRPTSIPDEEAVLLAIKNREAPVITDFIKGIIDEYIDLVDARIETLENQGEDPRDAIAIALSESKLSKHVALYFKIKNIDADDCYISLIESIIEQKNSSDNGPGGEKKESSVDIDETSTISEGHFSVSGAESESSLERDKNGDFPDPSVFKELAERNVILSQQLEDSNNQIRVLKEQLNSYSSKLEALSQRLAYEEKINVDSFISPEYDHTSLCEVTEPDNNGNKYLFRLADIDRQGRLDVFYPDTEKSLDFDNRNKLYYADGKSSPGKVAIWDWSAVPNTNDASRDYLKRHYNRHLEPIEIVIYKDCETIDGLLSKIKSGVKEVPHTEKILYAIYLAKGQCTGVLCTYANLEVSPECCMISSKVIDLPRYEFSLGDTIKTENGKYYYRNINIGIPAEIIRIKSSKDIVRSLLLSRSTWALFKEKGYKRSEWKGIKDFLESIDTDSLVDDIVDQAHCPVEEAKTMIDDFIEYANTYIDGMTIEDEILYAIISVNDTLKSQLKNALTEEWEAEHKASLAEAEHELRRLDEEISLSKIEYEREIAESKRKSKEQIALANAEMAKVKREHQYLIEENEKIKAEISSNEALASDVETSVSERIKKAQENAAEFIANLAFIHPAISISDKTDSDTKESEPNEEIIVQMPDQEKNTFYSGEKLLSDNLEISISWKDTLEILTDELIEVGVSSEYCRPLAGFLYAAYLNHVPIFLVGPNSIEIADAFSASLFGKTAGTLECTESYSDVSVASCLSSSDKIIKVLYPLERGWTYRLPDLINDRSKYFFVIHPFNEDIQIEPSSRYIYMLPVLTSLFIEKEPTGQIMGGNMSGSFEEYKLITPERSDVDHTVTLRAPKLIRHRLHLILTNMHKMLNDKNSDYDVLFGLLPYAYATMQLESFIKTIRSADTTLRISKNLRNSISDLFGEYE